MFCQSICNLKLIYEGEMMIEREKERNKEKRKKEKESILSL